MNKSRNSISHDRYSDRSVYSEYKNSSKNKIHNFADQAESIDKYNCVNHRKKSHSKYLESSSSRSNSMSISRSVSIERYRPRSKSRHNNRSEKNRGRSRERNSTFYEKNYEDYYKYERRSDIDFKSKKTRSNFSIDSDRSSISRSRSKSNSRSKSKSKIRYSRTRSNSRSNSIIRYRRKSEVNKYKEKDYYYDYDRRDEKWYYNDRNWKGYNTPRYSNKYKEKTEFSQRSFSMERERSRERERKRRKLQAECIKRAGGFQKLAQSEGKEPTPVFYDGFQWVAKTGTTATMDPATMNNTRRFRRLYFGNLPLNVGLTEADFQQIVWQEMANRGLCINPKENPILCVWFAQKKGNYGFIEFRTVEETEKALFLDGFDCKGSKIKVSRPNDYSQAILNSTNNNINQNQNLNLKPITFLNNKIDSETAFILGQQTANILIENLNTCKNTIQNFSDSKVLRIIQVLEKFEIQNDDDYEEIRKDICEGIDESDSIISSRIINPNDIKIFEKDQNFIERDIKINITDIFVEFKSNFDLQKSISVISLKKYNNKPLNIEIFDEEFYYKHLKLNKESNLYS